MTRYLRRSLTLLLTFVAAFALTLVVKAVPAHAGPGIDPVPDYLYTHCVSYGEFANMTGGPMRKIEAQLGVTGHGRVVHIGDHGTTLIKQYRACGFFEDAVMVQITYYLNKAGEWIGQWAFRFDYRDLPFQHTPPKRVMLA